MIGNDLVKYHNYMHGPVHYSADVATFPLSDWGITQQQKDIFIKSFPGASEDSFASQEHPFSGTMFIQGCVSAKGWLNDEGECVKLATRPITGCKKVEACGDHMRGPLHFSHQDLTIAKTLSTYDFRNAEVDFDVNKNTFKTVVCDWSYEFSNELHITPKNMKPGCVSTLRIIVPPDAPKSYIKLAFHPDMRWLNSRPIWVLQGFEAIISFECYGTRVRDVYCSYRERCNVVCTRWGDCNIAGLSGFDTEEGTDADLAKLLAAAVSGSDGSNPLSACYLPLQFIPWRDQCNTTNYFDVSSRDHVVKYMYDFKDYYDGDGGTRLWNVYEEVNEETGEMEEIKEWYYSGNQANMFDIILTRGSYAGFDVSPKPIVKVYRGEYTSFDSEPLSGDLIYDSSEVYDKDHPWVYTFPGSKKYSVKFDSTKSKQYIITLTNTQQVNKSTGTITVGCPFYYVAHRYAPVIN